jgi:hypothetical protein
VAPTCFRSWTAADPIAPVAPWTSTSWPRRTMAARIDEGGVVRALAAGRRLLEGQALRDGRHQPVLGHDQVLGVGPKVVPRNPNTRSPTLQAVTPSPTASTSPANSVPKTVRLGRRSPRNNR